MIDKERVVKGLEHCQKSYCDGCPYVYDLCDEKDCIANLARDVLVVLKKQPDIVRCENCKHSCDYTDIYPDNAYKCTKNGGYHNDSWFCADGEV